MQYNILYNIWHPIFLGESTLNGKSFCLDASDRAFDDTFSDIVHARDVRTDRVLDRQQTNPH